MGARARTLANDCFPILRSRSTLFMIFFLPALRRPFPPSFTRGSPQSRGSCCGRTPLGGAAEVGCLRLASSERLCRSLSLRTVAAQWHKNHRGREVGFSNAAEYLF